jgi:hypothetical protein
MGSTCGNMFTMCLEDSGLDECESLEEPILTCSSCQDIYDNCLVNAPGLDPVVCQSEFVDCVNAVALEAWCTVAIECDQCMGLYANCMENTMDGTACLGLFSDCVSAGGLNDGSCAPVWEPGLDQCDECMGDYATCMETTDGSTCLNDFDTCVSAAGINDGSCAPVWEPGDPCGTCQDGLSMCLTEVPDRAFCRDEFDQCVTDEGASECAITCELCQDLQIACEHSGGEYELCISEVFAGCAEIGNLSPDTCTPAYD